MFGLDMLDVAIGIAFVYLLVSLLCSAIVGGLTDDPRADRARHAVLTLINAAGGDAQKARENIEFWFNTSMDRVSGWYKRRAQRALFVIGLIVAIGLNIDTVRILRELM